LIMSLMRRCGTVTMLIPYTTLFRSRGARAAAPRAPRASRRPRPWSRSRTPHRTRPPARGRRWVRAAVRRRGRREVEGAWRGSGKGTSVRPGEGGEALLRLGGGFSPRIRRHDPAIGELRLVVLGQSHLALRQAQEGLGHRVRGGVPVDDRLEGLHGLAVLPLPH